eukprot:83332_1
MLRKPLNVSNKSINHESAAFTQHYKLLCISIDRLSKFLDNNHWTDVNMSTKRLYYDKCPPTNIQVYSPKHTQNETRPLFSTIMQEAKWDECKIGQSFGPSWSTHWFKLTLKPKDTWNKNKEIHLLWNSNSEATLWNKNGKCLQGFAGEWEQKREEYIFDKNTKFPLTLYVEMACNHRFGNGQDSYQGVHGAPDNDHMFILEQCELGLFNRLAWDLLWNLKVIHDLVIYDLPFNLNGNSKRRLQILRDTNEVINIINPTDETTYSKGIEITNKILYNYNHTNDQHTHTVYAIGHCHIDTAWLWPYAETRRKVIRSWASQLKLFELYNYHFTASQAQQYEWLLLDCKELFKRIQNAIKNDKTFHFVGGTWIEMDGNIPCGESFVRQFLYGQEFFLKYFGRRCKIFWLPDTFGYSGQLPQIIRQCGCDYFLTQKLSWNTINKFPHHTFIWEGIDGSSVLTHFPPADTYVSQCKVIDILKSRNNYKNKSRMLCTFLRPYIANSWTQQNIKFGLDLIDKMLCYDPKKRIKPNEALKHKWFKISPNGLPPKELISKSRKSKKATHTDLQKEQHNHNKNKQNKMNNNMSHNNKNNNRNRNINTHTHMPHNISHRQNF